MKTSVSKVCFLPLLCLAAGCKQSADQAPNVPTNLIVERKETTIRNTWNGETVNYDFQESWQDSAHGWIDQKAEALTNVPQVPGTGNYFKDVNALPQPMRFRVKAVRGELNSGWTDWVTNSATIPSSKAVL